MNLKKFTIIGFLFTLFMLFSACDVALYAVNKASHGIDQYEFENSLPSFETVATTDSSYVEADMRSKANAGLWDGWVRTFYTPPKSLSRVMERRQIDCQKHQWAWSRRISWGPTGLLQSDEKREAQELVYVSVEPNSVEATIERGVCK